MMTAYVYDAIRTPRGRGRHDGALHELTSVWLSAFTINVLVTRNSMSEAPVDDVIWGNVTQVGEQGGCLARAAVLMSQLGEGVPGLSINRFCASGLEAVNLAANQANCHDSPLGFIAGGVEMMSRVPMGSDGAAMAVDPELAMKHYFVPQGISADILATEHSFNRRECDEYAVESQLRATRAWQEERFRGSVVPVTDRLGLTLLDRDESLRPATTVDDLARLEPSFRHIGEQMPGFDEVAILRYPHLERIDHVHHAGNSSGIVDGAAAVLIGNGEFGAVNGLVPRAKIVTTSRVGSDPTIMLTGPVGATRLALERGAMQISDIDLFEVNEAFASVPLHFMKELGVGHDRLNVNGGAIAMGHPLGATGAMLLGTALDELERVDKSLALVTLCVAGGMGVATIIDRNCN